MMNKEECSEALTRLLRPYFVSTEIQNAYYDINKGHSIDYDSDVLTLLIKEHFELVEKIKTGELSDGYHTFNELYYHRAVLFSVICNSHKDIAWKSKKHHDGTMYNDMFIVGIDTPQGQYSCHYDMNIWSMFDVKELEYAPKWDGHKPSDIERLRSIEKPQPYKFEELKKGMWVWDDKGSYCFKCNPAISKNGTRCVTYNAFWYNCGEDEDEFFEEYDEFEEDRFFPLTKAMEYQE